MTERNSGYNSLGVWMGTWPREVVDQSHLPKMVVDYDPEDGGCHIFSVNFTDLSVTDEFKASPCQFSSSPTPSPTD